MIGNHKLWLFGLMFITVHAIAQRTPVTNANCPPNIGFESGTFDNWECFAGVINRDGTVNVSATSPISDRHAIIPNTYPQQLDAYGNFPVNCPNGSGYSVRLGNSSAGGQAERLSYTFSIPSNKNAYSILYNYAVVFQNPPHQPQEQPRFSSKIFNVTDNTYIDCGSFQFVASSNLPGFQLSSSGSNVFFKPWSPVTVNLSGLAGKTVRLEFTTNDCAFTQHFGYAYLDVNEDCSSEPISGNTYCGGAETVTLTAPYGFATYSWYTADFSKLLGTENILKITPPPPANTTYAVVITPYDGVGCEDTLYSTIHSSPEPFKLNILDSISDCPSGVDITSPNVTAGSTPGLTYTYYSDVNEINYVPVPSKITIPGIYYIKGENASGCSDIKPINVTIKPLPGLIINNPEGVCIPKTIDITDLNITAGSEAGIKLTYWKNAAANNVLSNPNAVNLAGIYYIKADNNSGCSNIQPVIVKIGEIPVVNLSNPTACGKIDLTAPQITAGSTAGLVYTYWVDTAATQALANPKVVTITNNYFIKSSSAAGCSVIKPILATVNPFPDFIVTDPKPVNYPVMTIDLTAAVNQNNGLTYSYWLDTLAKRSVSNPKAVNKRATYYIKGTNEFGCSIIKPVQAAIIPPPDPIIYAPTAFTPNNDEINDVFRIKIIGETAINHLRIYNRWGQVIYDDPNLNHTWNGKLKGIEVPGGVYIWIIDGMDTYYNKSFSQKGLITLIR